MSTDDDHATRSSRLQSSIDVLVESTRSVTQLVARTGSAGARAVLPTSVLEPVNRMLSSLRSMAEQAPLLTDEIDVLMSELQAKRLSIQAVTAELVVLDQQLEILERTMTPVQGLSTQLKNLQHSLMHALDPVQTP